MSPIAIAAYFVLFAVAGLSFVFLNLLIGRFVRPNNPSPEKGEIYECGEPTIGSSFVQFDLRFYVVALLFLIFDLEVAFFFPWATVFGKANDLRDPQIYAARRPAEVVQRDETVEGVFRELGVAVSAMPDAADGVEIQRQARNLAWFSFADIGVFFAIVLVGFAYVWMRGDLDWVRAVSKQRGAEAGRAEPTVVGPSLHGPSTDGPSATDAPGPRQPTLV